MAKKRLIHIIIAFFVSLTAYGNHSHNAEESGSNHAAESQEYEKHEEHHQSHSAEPEGAIDTEEEIDAYKKHHLQDSHDFHLFSYDKGKKHVGFPLPVILLDNGIQIFMSSKFHHGHSAVESSGNNYVLYHGKIYRADTHGNLNFDEQGHPTNKKPLDLSITKNVFGMLLTGLLMILGFGSLAKGYKKSQIPTGIGRILEPLVIYVRDDIARPNIGEKHYKKFMSFLLTVFFFIWTLNLLGLTPLGFNVTGNIAVTVCLAIFTFIIVQVKGNKQYWGHIFWMPGVPVPMKIILAPIEVLGMFTKPFSLLIRLFANITAGHFVVMSLIALLITKQPEFGVGGSFAMSFALSFFISIIELLVAFLQAYIFTMLTSLFIGMSVVEHDHH